MKIPLLSLLFTISALFFTESSSHAQSKDCDRDWIDSLAVSHRIDFITRAMLRDQATLDSVGEAVFALSLNLQKLRKPEQATINRLAKTLRRYDDERQLQHVRRSAYKEEMRFFSI